MDRGERGLPGGCSRATPPKCLRHVRPDEVALVDLRADGAAEAVRDLVLPEHLDPIDHRERDRVQVHRGVGSGAYSVRIGRDEHAVGRCHRRAGPRRRAGRKARSCPLPAAGKDRRWTTPAGRPVDRSRGHDPARWRRPDRCRAPCPEGRACAEVLQASAGDPGRGRWIFRGLVIGAVCKVLVDLLGLSPAELVWTVPFVPNGEFGLQVAPALICVGYILGYRQSAICVSGGVVSALLLIPLITTILVGAGQLAPSAGDLWKSHVRYIGVGAVACAGIVTVARGLPRMVAAFSAVARRLAGDESRAGPPPRTDRDVPGWVVGAAILAVVLAIILIPGLLGGDLVLGQRALVGIGVGVFGLVFVAVASRIVGLVGTSSQPTSGICLVTLLGLGVVFSALGWTDLAGAAIVAVAVGLLFRAGRDRA